MIRRATETDIPALCRLMQLVQTAHARVHPEIFRETLDVDATPTFFREVLSKERNLVLVAEMADEVIGYLWCQEHVSSGSFYARAAHTGYINHISVDPRHQRRGIGGALVEATLADLKQRGATRIGVDFWSFNDGARAFFGRFGFVVQREVCSRDL